MVLASSPVDSANRLAARPVGALSSMRTPLARRIRRILFTTVVFPTPGPPVIIVAFGVGDCTTSSTLGSRECHPGLLFYPSR